MSASVIIGAARRAAGLVLGLLPNAVLGRILPGPYRFRSKDVAEPPPLEGERRVIIAPLNYAGQAFEWCRAIERADPRTSAQNFMIRMPHDFRHAADYTVPVGAYAASGRWHHRWSAHVMGRATHVIVEGQKQPLGSILRDSTMGQVHRLQSAGIRVAMLCHGSDIRLPSRHALHHPASPFTDPSHDITARLERAVRLNSEILGRLQLPVFVSTPDLLLDVPGARWLPVVVDPERWKSSSPPLQRAVPVVVHAPSSGWIKGSDLIDPVMRRLHEEGLIEYRRLRGVPHAEMPEAYQSADIVLEQFRIGNYGVAACEGMAAGRVVIGYISDQVADAVRDQSGVDLPIVRTEYGMLESRIRDILANREASCAVAASGPAFVREVHDGRFSARVLEPFLSEHH